jgi:hypothetical protein
MSISHPPSVFVSSTCYDLAQVRHELRLFLESLGMVPVLSEFSSFPVNPNLDAIENCLAAVKQKADIFVLVVGGRYGSETENGKSVTNLEYLEAKAKGIPLYVFVHKSVLDTLPIWQKNRSDDFSTCVDSPKLFDFVVSLMDPKENWVFSFDSAQDLIGTLRTQLAYLFRDALTIREKVLASGLPEELSDLSSAALRLVVEKPYAWEYRLFSQVLCDEISKVAKTKKDLDYGLVLGRVVKLNDFSEINAWVATKLDEIQLLVNSLGRLFDTALPKAVGAPGEPGDIKEIVYVGKRFAEVYMRILEWTIEFRHTLVDERFSHLLEIISRLSGNVIDEIEAYAIDLNRQLDNAVRQYENTKQSQSLELILTLTCPDMTELEDEMRRLSEQMGFEY